MSGHSPSARTAASRVRTSESEAAALRDELALQLNHRVQWQQSVETMVSAGVGTFLEIGPGTVLSGLIKRTSAHVRTAALNDPQTITTAAAGLAA